MIGNDLAVALRRPPAAAPHRRASGSRRRRLGDLHVGIHRYAEGRGRVAPVGRRLRRRRGADVPPRRPAGTPGPGDGRSLGRPSTRPARRCGWPGRTAPAWCPAPRSLVRSGVDVGPWLVANDITVVSTVPTLVALWPTESLAAVRLLILGGEACPPEIGARLAHDGPRGLEHLRSDRGDRRRRAAHGSTRTGRCGSGCRSTGGTSPSSTRRGIRAARARSGELIIGGVGLARYLDPDKDAEKYAPMPSLGWAARLPQR